MSQRADVTGHAHLTADGKLLTIWTVNCRGQECKTSYQVSYLESHPEIGAPAWRLEKLNKDGTPSGVTYDVILTRHGAICCCPDFIFCREGKCRAGCKHTAAATKVGLMKQRDA